MLEGIFESTSFLSLVFLLLAEATSGHKASQDRSKYQAARKVFRVHLPFPVTESSALQQQNVEMGQTTAFRRRKDIHLSHNVRLTSPSSFSPLVNFHTANVSLKPQAPPHAPKPRAPKSKHFQSVTGGKPCHPVIFTHAYTIQ